MALPLAKKRNYALIASLSLILASCTAPVQPVAGPLSPEGEEYCNSISSKIYSLRSSPESINGTGFKKPVDLGSGISLYDTFWYQEIYHELGYAINVDPTVELEAALRNTQQTLRQEGDRNGTPLHIIQMINAIQGNSGAQVVDVADELRRLQSKSGYSWSKSDNPDPGSTYVGIEIVSQLPQATQVDRHIIDYLLGVLRKNESNSDIAWIISEGIPSLAGLSIALDSDSLLEEIQNSSDIITSWRNLLIDSELDPVIISALSSLENVRKKVLPHIPPTSVDFSDFPSAGGILLGYDGIADPQLTYYATNLGYRNVRLFSSIEQRKSEIGWLASSRESDLESSYVASSILKQCGKPVPESQGVLSSYLKDEGNSSVRDLYMACALDEFQYGRYRNVFEDRLGEISLKLSDSDKESNVFQAYSQAIFETCSIGAKPPISNFSEKEQIGPPDLIIYSILRNDSQLSPRYRSYIEKLQGSNSDIYKVDQADDEDNIFLTSVVNSLGSALLSDRERVAANFACGSVFTESRENGPKCRATGMLEQLAGLSLLNPNPYDLLILVPENWV